MPKTINTLPLVRKINAAKRSLLGKRCPKCGGLLQLQNDREYSHDKCWRPMPNTHPDWRPSFYVACERFCWKGPWSNDPGHAVEDWLDVMEAWEKQTLGSGCNQALERKPR